MFGGQGGQGCGHVIALGHDRPISTGSARLGKHRRDEAFAGLADQHRISGGSEGLESGQQRQVVLDAGLGEAQARVDDNALRLHAGGQHTVDLAHEFVVYVGQYTVLVDGGVLIGVRALGTGEPAAPMLHDVQAVVVGDHMRQFGIQRATGNIVDDLGALAQRSGGHGCARGVDGQYGTGRNQCLDGTGDAGQFVGLGHALGAGARGFGADVDDIRAGGHHVAPVLGRLGRVQPQAAVRGRVLGDVEHTHHHGVRSVMQRLQISHYVSPSM